MRAHPRVCGENAITSAYKHSCAGSSPRVRGKPLLFNITVSLCGLIPACAGKTGNDFSRAGNNAAHPRVCGENHVLSASNAGMSGSSPRVRGKRVPA